ncbi:MAG: N-acetyltransferase [Tessaracoccus sp.]|uniref:GNAT family N-acetyltransferase n=1 Tax=Tessaracoccus sp. TaxID=1971211 RepID=UPI001ECB2876|nr:GNAT family N-acetyltransferase [Tessaracoccus sp.]MBK7820291.1 N-acetyltransferase [Tessaracoccus sp.]
MSDENVTLSKNAEDNRYELRVGDEVAGFIDYDDNDGVLDMHHTEVDPSHGGKGFGQQLVAFALADARAVGAKVVPTCPFIAKYIERHPAEQDLLATGS